MQEGNKEFTIDSNSKELMIKWQRKAEKLKKRHPQWDDAKIERKMQKYIISDAKKAFSSKDTKAYIEEMKSIQTQVEAARNSAIERIMVYMGQTSPDAVATALFELDCGCIRACAVSEEGAPMGEMIMVSGRQVEKDYECDICRNDGGASPERCIRKAMVWPGEESELPSEEFRLSIGKKVFGDEYSLDDI